MVLIASRASFSSAMIISGLVHLGLMLSLLYQNWSSHKLSEGQAGLVGSFVELGSARTETKSIVRPALKNGKRADKFPQAEVENVNLSQESDVSIRSQEAAPVLTTSEATQSGDAQRGQYDEYTRDLVRLIHQKKVYPRMAQKMGHTGRILVTLKIGRDGSILQSDVVEQSGFSTLNDAAKKLLQDLQKMKPFPEGVSERFWVFHVPIEYKL